MENKGVNEMIMKCPAVIPKLLIPSNHSASKFQEENLCDSSATEKQGISGIDSCLKEVISSYSGGLCLRSKKTKSLF
jgi:hypothetical protein